MNFRKMQFAGFAFVLFASMAFAQSAFTNVTTALTDLCTFITTVIPIVVMLMLVGAGAIYAGGQMMGAETRARANVWATAMLTGALIGVLIIVVAPIILTTMYGGTDAIFNWATCTIT